jgi:hypothetical protein
MHKNCGNKSWKEENLGIFNYNLDNGYNIKVNH